jgi:CDP-6-deoxy-D-xylo-4-hexulose-3-dehydrase
MDEIELRNEIYDKVKELYAFQQKNKQPFIPGKSYINYAGRIHDEKEMVGLVDTALDFWLTAGKLTDKFERNLAQFVGTNYCIFTNSGSSANLLAVSALTSPKLKERQLKPGDEVITSPCGFPTTLNPIIQNRLIPLFVDIKLGTYNIDTEILMQAITNKTKAIKVSHT